MIEPKWKGFHATVKKWICVTRTGSSTMVVFFLFPLNQSKKAYPQKNTPTQQKTQHTKHNTHTHTAAARRPVFELRHGVCAHRASQVPMFRRSSSTSMCVTRSATLPWDSGNVSSRKCRRSLGHFEQTYCSPRINTPYTVVRGVPFRSFGGWVTPSHCRLCKSRWHRFLLGKQRK